MPVGIVKRVLNGAVAAGALAAAACTALPSDRGGAALAADRGCSTCHSARAVPLGHSMPVAPSWQEIAERYRREAGAEQALVAAVVGGTAERHWKGSPFVTMLPHEKWVTEDEARELVRWILAR